MGRIWIRSIALAAAATASQADARYVVTDNASYQSFTPCSLTAPCTNFFSTTSEADSWTEQTNNSSKTISFNLNYGSGDQTRIYAYDNGLFSVGTPLSGTPSAAGSFSDLGSNVFSPLYYAPGLQTSDFQYSYGVVDNLQRDLQGREYLRIRYNVVYQNVTTKVETDIVAGTSDGDFLLYYGYGQPQYEADVPDTALIGYQLGTHAENKRAGDFQTQIKAGGDPSLFFYTFANDATGTVPEPATWAMMIMGIGAVGTFLRRKDTRWTMVVGTA